MRRIFLSKVYTTQITRTRAQIECLPCMNASLAQIFSCTQMIVGFTLFIIMRMKITRHNKCSITWWTTILKEAHCPYCGVASCGAPGSFHAHMIFLIVVEMSFNRHTCCGVEVVNGWTAVFISISAVISKENHLSLHTPPSVTRNPQTSPITFLSRRKISPKMLWIGTWHSLTSEQPCIQDRNTGKLDELSYLSNMTSKEEEEEIILVKCYSLTRIKLTVQTNNLTKSTFTCISTNHHSCQIFTPTYTQSIATECIVCQGLWKEESPEPGPEPIHDSRLLYYLIRETKTWLNINHIAVHSNTYCIF